MRSMSAEQVVATAQVAPRTECPEVEVSLMEVVKTATPIVGIAVAAFVFRLGILQHRSAQRWKRNEFAASILKELNTDEDLVACCNVLDYRKRCIVLSHKKTKDDKPTILEHDRAKLPAAMAVSAPPDGFIAEQIAYRDLFDRMCSYLSQVAHACSQELIEPGDVRPLRYWLERMANVPNYENVLTPFIQRYHPGVIELARLFKSKNLLDETVVAKLSSAATEEAQQQPSR